MLLIAAGCELPGSGSSKTQGSSTTEPLSSSFSASVPKWAEDEGFADNAAAMAGARLFAQVGCLSCHTYQGTGSAALGAPDLSAIGRDSERDSQGFADYVADPSEFGDDVMPSFKALGRARLLRLGAFLEASRGGS